MELRLLDLAFSYRLLAHLILERSASMTDRAANYWTECRVGVGQHIGSTFMSMVSKSTTTIGTNFNMCRCNW